LNGKIGMADVARLYSETPAKRYGLFPRKGHLGLGADADFVLVDPATSWTVDPTGLLSKAGWSPYSGRVLQGCAVATYLRGEEIARNGVAHQLRTGRFVDGPGATS
jgi:dihydroorotase